MKELFLEFISFLRSPDRDSFSQSSFENQVIEVVKLFMMTFVAVIFLVMPLMSLIGADDLPNKLVELENLGFDHKWQQNLALFTLAVIAAPLIEEVIFRFPLKFFWSSISVSISVSKLVSSLVLNLVSNFIFFLFYFVISILLPICFPFCFPLCSPCWHFFRVSIQ